jgi:hypothetical protein
MIENRNRRGILAVLGVAGLLTALGSCTDMMTNNPNREPVVSISPASYTMYPGDEVTFDAGATFDPDDQDLDVKWEVISAPSGSTYFLDGVSSFAPTFNSYYRNLPGEDASDRYAVGPEDYSVPAYLGDYTLRMTISDEYGVQRTGTVSVTVTNSAPGAAAGNDSIGAIDPAATATPAALVLTGTGGELEESSRRNTWQYRWSVTGQPAGSNLSLTSTAWTVPSDPAAAHTAVADFTPLTTGSDDKPGEGVYVLRLDVRDEYGATSSDSMIVATSGNTRPALSGPTVTAGTDTISGTGASDDPYRDNDTDGDDDANDTINLNFVAGHVTNDEDDTMTVTWRVHSLPAGVEELKFRVDGGGDQLYRAGATLKTQGIVTGDEPDFELDIAPAADLTDVIRNTNGTRNDATAVPDHTGGDTDKWDLAIQIVANDGAVSDATPPVVYLDLYTPVP